MARMRRPGIYAITCTFNGHQYVGSSVDIPDRWNGHKNTLRRGINNCPILQNAWIKHGEAAFEFSVLEYVEDVTTLLVREQYYIDTLQPMYNFSLFANSPSSDPKVAAKIAASLTGKKLSAAHRAHISASQEGKVQLPEINLKRSTTMKGSPKILGVPKSDTHKESVRQGVKKLWADPEYRARMVEAAKNRKKKPAPRSQESRDKTSKSRKTAWERQLAEGYENMPHDDMGRFKGRSA